MTDKTRAAEPLLVSGMRRHPTGDVRHVPAPPTGACGTSTAGFLRELDEWATQVRAETLREAADYCERPDEPTGCCGVISAVDLRRLAASPAPTETHCARCTSFAPDCPYCQTAQADLARATAPTEDPAGMRTYLLDAYLDGGVDDEWALIDNAQPDDLRANLQEAIRRLTPTLAPTEEGSQAEAPDMRYPEGRPGWLGEYQPWPCGRCRREVDDAGQHDCRLAPTEDPS